MATDEELSLHEAIRRGIINQSKGVYLNKADNTEMPLADALDSGLLVVEFDTEETESSEVMVDV